MKRIIPLLFSIAFCSFTLPLHAEDDVSGIVTSLTISNIPDDNGQYTVILEAYVKGNATSSSEESYQPVDPKDYGSGDGNDKLFEYLGFNSTTDAKNWVKNNYEGTTKYYYSGGSNCTLYLKQTQFYYYVSADKSYYPVYYGIDDNKSYNGFYYKKNSSYKDINITATNNTMTLTNFYIIEENEHVTWNASYAALGTNSQMSVSFDGFMIPSGATITKQTASCTAYSDGTPTFGPPSTALSGTVTVPDDRQTITISGFDFSDNFCGGPDDDNHYMGNKFIVTFPVIPCYNTAANFENSHSFLTSSSVTNNNGTEVKSGMFSASGKLPNLTVSASGTDIKATDNFIFTVTGPTQLPEASRKTFKVMIQGGNSVTLKAIPAGTYSIIADSWPWTYTIDEGNKSVTSTMDLSSSSTATASVTFTFTPESITNPHHGEATASTPAN